MERRHKRPGFTDSLIGALSLQRAVLRTLAVHVGHGGEAIDQRAPRPLMWFTSRYEHLLMRAVDFLAMRDWLYRNDTVKRMLNRLGDFVMSIVNGEVLTLGETREMISSIFEEGYTVAIGTCPCRRALNAISDEVPNNTDMVFGLWAEQYLDHYPDLYRKLEPAEAISLVDDFDRHGFLHQLYGFRTREGAAYVLCNCDPGICIPLRAQKARGYPAFRKGRSVAVVDTGSCLGVEQCGICLERCPFDVRYVAGEKAAVAEDRCFGCGLCVSTCKGEATSLERKKGAKLVYARHLVE